MRRLILLACLTIAVHAKHIVILETEDYLGRVTFESGVTIIAPSEHSIHDKLAYGFTSYACDTDLCIDELVTKYTSMYRTQGVTVDIID
jgi:hypothetical protein